MPTSDTRDCHCTTNKGSLKGFVVTLALMTVVVAALGAMMFL